MINFKDLIIKKFIPIAKLIFTYAFLHFFFKGGRGSTKSSFIALVLVVLMIIDKEFNAVCVRKVADTLQDSVYNQIIWAIEMLGLRIISFIDPARYKSFIKERGNAFILGVAINRKKSNLLSVKSEN